MRLRAGHVTIAAVVLVTAFVMVAVYMGSSGPGKEEVVEGALPPEGASQDEVASMAVDATEVDLGVIPNTGQGHAKLAVHNRGRGPLKVMEVRSSCACTAGAFAPGALPIPPGGSADLNITVDPTRIFGFESRKTLTLYTNDPVRPSLEVTVSAKIDPEFELEPRTIEFGTVRKGAGAAKEIRLRALIDTPLHVTGVTPVQPESKEPEPEGLRLEVVPVPEAEWKTAGHAEYVIRASISPDMRTGPFELAAYIATDLKRFRFYRVPITGVVEAPYTVKMPTSLRTVVIQPGETGARVEVTADAPVALESAVPESGTVTVSGAEIPGGIALVFAPAPGQVVGRHDDRVKVRLRVGDSTYDELFETRVFGGPAPQPQQ